MHFLIGHSVLVRVLSSALSDATLPERMRHEWMSTTGRSCVTVTQSRSGIDNDMRNTGAEMDFARDVSHSTRFDSRTSSLRKHNTVQCGSDPPDHTKPDRRSVRYTKDALLSVYRDLRNDTSTLSVPSNAQIPIPFRKGSRVALEDSRCASWIWITPGGAPFFTLTYEEVRERLNKGVIQPSDYLLPTSVVRQCGIRASDFDKVDIKRDNGVGSLKPSIPSPIRKWRDIHWQELCKVLDSNEVCYLDTSNQLQGPFEKKQILQWWARGYFPKNLHVRSSHAQHFVDLRVLLAKWFSSEALWHASTVSHSSCTQEFLVQQFCKGKLDSQAPIIPSALGGTEQTLPALYLMVHWLPFCETWSVKEESYGVTSLSIPGAFDLWLHRYRTQNGRLLARPVTWGGNGYMAMEHMMESYSFIE